jgi:hypothetical protein
MLSQVIVTQSFPQTLPFESRFTCDIINTQTLPTTFDEHPHAHGPVSQPTTDSLHTTSNIARHTRGNVALHAYAYDSCKRLAQPYPLHSPERNCISLLISRFTTERVCRDFRCSSLKCRWRSHKVRWCKPITGRTLQFSTFCVAHNCASTPSKQASRSNSTNRLSTPQRHLQEEHPSDGRLDPMI